LALQHQLTIADQRPASERLVWLTLQAPELARAARPGQALLLRCAEPGSADPLLRRALPVAAAEERLGQIGLLYAPDERGLAWLAHRRPGERIDALGLFGAPFALDRRTRNLLLVGQGPGLAALLLLARQHAARGGAVALLAGADEPALLPPPFLLPADVEYQSVVGRAVELLLPQTKDEGRRTKEPPKAKRRPQQAPDSLPPAPLSGSAGVSGTELLTWADQLCAALPEDQLAPLAEALRTVKYRWERGFASALLEAPLVCGLGACGVCAVETRKGQRLACVDGPVFDLRDLPQG
jgi:dihydroorotate dehydrogenase electron transfer subunit